MTEAAGGDGHVFEVVEKADFHALDAGWCGLMIFSMRDGAAGGQDEGQRSCQYEEYGSPKTQPRADTAKEVVIR
ncbi:MAG: hypothetical protein ACOCSQ_01830 [Planctomycetota bacterium]